MPYYEEQAAPGASGSVNTSVAQTWTGLQTFEGYIIVNGVKFRPLIMLPGSDVVMSWEFEHNGVWKQQSSTTNP